MAPVPVPGRPARSRARSRRARRIVLVIAFPALLGLGADAFAGRGEAPAAMARIEGGSPKRGRAAIQKYGCASCHTIPGVRGSRTTVGPSLAGIARRATIAGGLTNRPENLMRWIRNPPLIDPLTLMPDLGVTQREARDIASYLYTLK